MVVGGGVLGWVPMEECDLPVDLVVAITEDIVALPREARIVQAAAGVRGRCGEGCRHLHEVIVMKALMTRLYQWRWKSMKSRLDRSLSFFWHRSVPHFRDVFFLHASKQWVDSKRDRHFSTEVHDGPKI